MRVYEVKFTSYNLVDMNAAGVSAAAGDGKDGAVGSYGSCARPRTGTAEFATAGGTSHDNADNGNIGWCEDGETVARYGCVYRDCDRKESAAVGTHTLRVPQEVPVGKLVPKCEFGSGHGVLARGLFSFVANPPLPLRWLKQPGWGLKRSPSGLRSKGAIFICFVFIFSNLTPLLTFYQ